VCYRRFALSDTRRQSGTDPPSADPDNYTDQATFLENLQRNPRVRPYDFWPLVADSTVIVQHVCSVIIFVVCFVGIFQERVSPVAVVSWSSGATFVGWLLWDFWASQDAKGTAGDEDARARIMRGGRAYRDSRPLLQRQDSSSLDPSNTLNASTVSISTASNLPSAASSTTNLLQDHYPPRSHPHTGQADSNGFLAPGNIHSRSVSSFNSIASQTSAVNSANSPTVPPTPASASTPGHLNGPDGDPNPAPEDPQPSRFFSPRFYVRLSTIKSAILIYFTLLGLSPILKSLTRSTSSDSIWAMSFWLLAINIFFFDYSGGSRSSSSLPATTTAPGTKPMPVASLSTNAALMASTVLASRLPSTGQVFSLTLFSIQVFGLFPVFRNCARRKSWRYHVALTVLLVLGAGAGVGMILGDPAPHDANGNFFGGLPWKRGLVGMIVGCLIAIVAMGGCSWWLISLQKYKNEIYGPWDPARPIIISRRHWEDE
jgi:phosphatidylinositol glycan class C protein